jgi:restriction endonuclease S subunit
MKKGWEIKKLGEVCQFINGRAYKQEELLEKGKYPVLRVGNLHTNRNWYYSDLELDEDKYCDNGDLLFAWSASFGPRIWTGNKVIYHYHIWKVIPNEKIINKHFLFYFLEWDTEALKNTNGTGTTMLHVGKGAIEKREIYLPHIAEQERIVAILDECFAAIDKAKENAEQNLRNAKELFDSYLNGIFERKGDDWEEKKLGDVCEFVRGPFGGSLKKNIFKPSGYAVYEQQHAIYDQFNDIRYFIDEAKFDEMKRFELREGDLIMSCSGTMGRVAIVPNGIRKGIINQALLKMSCGKNILNTFLKFWMESKGFQDSLKENAGGAAIQNVASVSILKSIKVTLPSIDKQQSLVQKLNVLRTETQMIEAIYEKKISDLDKLKISILHKGFIGELETDAIEL